MTDLLNGEILDILPSQLNTDIDMICLSYAIKTVCARLMEYEGESMIYAGVDRLKENVLDLLAVEMQAPYYDQTLTIDVKREIIKKTFVWHQKAGTTSAVRELVAVVFGEGNVVEWPDFTDGEKTPGTFDIETNALMTPDMIERFNGIIGQVKSVRSHLRRVTVCRRQSQNSIYAAGTHGYVKAPAIRQKRPSLGENRRYAAGIGGYTIGTKITQVTA